MAPAAFLSSGAVQPFCPTTSAMKRWQPKRLVSSRSALTRASPHGNMDKISVKSSISLGSLDSVLGGRRRSCLGPETGSPSRHVVTAAVEGSIALNETSPAAFKVSESEEEKIAEFATAAVVPPPTKSERFKPRVPGQKARREDPMVPGEALVQGAVFTGKVTTIQPFGAFVNFGAFTDGLVHISKMSTGYVSNVRDIVSLGQEVKVTILNVEQKSGRIALSMVDKEELEAKEVAAKTGEAREGSERSLFHQLSEGRPVNRGRVTGGGRQNRRDEPQKSPTKLVKGQEVEGTVKNKIRAGVFVELLEHEEGFLRYSDIPGGENMGPESSLQTGEKINATVLRIDRGKILLTMKPILDIFSVNRDINKGKDSGATNPFEIAFRAFNLIPTEPTSPVEENAGREEIVPPDTAVDVEKRIPEAAIVVEEVVPEVTASVKVTRAAEQEVLDALSSVVEVALPAEEEVVSKVCASVEDIVIEVTSSLTDEETSTVEEAPAAVKQKMIPKTTSIVDEISSESVPETKAAVKLAPTGEEEVAVVVEDSPGAIDEALAVEKFIPMAAPVVAEAPNAGEEVIPKAPSTPTSQESVAEKVTVGISPTLVKQLRDETGAGMMDCKRALADTRGDIEKACEILRKKGLASADKKASRIASEGLVGSYIHDSRIGVLVEVNCETDFVSRGPDFKSLVEDIGLQVVASQQVQFVSVEDIPTEIVNKEKEMEAQSEDLMNKPEAIRVKIVEGRVVKRLKEIALLEQPYIRDDKILVKDFVKQTAATLGENIKVRRFERYVLGEGLQKKGTDFAAEVAAQAGVKAPVEPAKIEEVPAPAPDSKDKVIVSAALVKKLRDQTGAGMMDCKKALTSTENDVEKAVEFLRKKGLASADKKSSRLASEGLIGTYIHDGRIGILVEVNCETDFVARGEKFKELVEDLAMQIAAYPQIQVVSVDDVPAETVAKEKELESGKEDLASRPEAIRARIVNGRVAKRLSELVLLEQPFIKDDKKMVKDILKETIAALGENIQVRRFTRFNLGEGIKKKVVDFASEVAAQSGRKT